MTEHYGVAVEPDVEIRVRIDGPDHGAPIVLLHGYLGSGRQWDANVESLVDAGYRVIRPDHRGHGASTSVGDESAYTFDHLHRDVRTIVEALGIERFHLVGHSMGGLIAELFAISDQERLLSLVLVDCSPFAGSHAERRSMTAVRRFVGYRLGPSRLVRGLRPVLRHVKVAAPPGRTPAERRDALVELERSVADVDPAAFVALGEQLAAHDDLRPFLGSIAVPTTVIVGEHEFARLRAGAAALRDGIPGARLVEIPGAGHSPPMERPARFDETLLDHLDRWTGHSTAPEPAVR